MHDARVKTPSVKPILMAMHPGNPHGLRYAEGEDDGKGGDGDDPEEDPEDDPEDDSDDDDDELVELLDADSDDDEEEVTVTREALEQMIESAVDRRINKKVQSRIRGGGQRRERDRSRTYRPSREDVRDARDAYREALDDAEFKFVTREERQLARDLAESHLASALVEHADPFEVGEDVADQVIDRIKAVRRAYRSQTVSALRSRGVLKETTGQKSGKGARKTSQASFEAGAQRAARMGLTGQTGDK